VFVVHNFTPQKSKMYLNETYKKVMPNNTLTIIYLSESVTIQKVKHLLLTVVLWLFTIEQMLEKGIAD